MYISNKFVSNAFYFRTIIRYMGDSTVRTILRQSESINNKVHNMVTALSHHGI